MVPEILIYLLKANVALTLCFLAYRLGLRKLTFYTLNRVFLLFGILVAAIFPLIDINSFVDRHEEIGQVLTYVPDLRQWQETPHFNYWNLLVYAFWAGVLIMMGRFMIQLFSMYKIHRSATDDAINGTPVKVLQSPVNPFSFFRNIYINPILHQPEEIDDILLHEQVHVRQWHSVDVVMGEINNIFYWFNPGAWLMKSAIRENLEFITDRYLLRQGVDRKNYQYSLLKISGIPYATAIANNFNFSHLKTRIMMMNKKKSSTYHMIRYVVLGALVGGIVLSLNYSRAATNVVSEIIPFVKAEPNPAPAARPQPVAIASVKPSAAPLADTGKPKEVRIIRLEKGDKQSDSIQVQVIERPKGDKDTYTMEAKEVVFVRADDVRTTIDSSGKRPRIVVTYNADTTKPERVVTGYGGKTVEKSKQTSGVVEAVTIQGRAMGVSTDTSKKVIRIVGTKAGHNPLYLVDGKEITEGEMKNIEPDMIQSINVLKGESAKKLYGEKGADGVILINLKKSK
ncbi:TonB-dependent Receptor Plug Domain [Chitinophaga jiangningensis]|uniref:TonB-dependent Receptor Plug Domain n=1 Tax=Chitinophaga jiangningensis TaxID=1419482 RepID=A0A1M7G395_9BACT|nr:M56 family metallopeptidase [Chitinophaga jiangningensis]SHM10427.1 TonB-dependent Receptor Plug Domain [Chitinophaga jiangningensis]